MAKKKAQRVGRKVKKKAAGGQKKTAGGGRKSRIKRKSTASSSGPGRRAGTPVKKKKKKKPGRKSPYKTPLTEARLLRMVEVMGRLGAIDEDMAAFFGVTDRTIDNWKNRFPKFFAALAEGKADADRQVMRSLFKRATGFSEGKKYFPPDTAACFGWLYNRMPEKWRQRQEHVHSGEMKVTLVNFADIKLKDDPQ